MATSKGKKNNPEPDSSAKAPQTESEATKSTKAAKEQKPVIDPEAANSTATQTVSPKTTPAKPSPEKPPEPEVKPAAQTKPPEKPPEPEVKPAAQTKPPEKAPEPEVKPAAAKVSQPSASAPPKSPEPVAAKASQPSYTPPATPAKPVVAPPPTVSPVSATVTSSQPSVTVVEPGVDPYGEEDNTFQEIKVKVVTFLENLPENTANFFQQNQKPLISLGLILALLITLKITAGLLDILNEIPLVKPLFEAIGVSYSAWFIYRYVLWFNTRQELSQKLNSAKEDILGENQKLS